MKKEVNMLKIRKLEERDRGPVKEMMRVFYASPAVMTDGSDEIFEKDITECISDSPFASGYIFEVDGELAGYSMLAHSFSTEFGKRCVWVEDLYIIPKFRRQGIGREYFSFLDRECAGCLLRLEAEEDNAPAIRLYEQAGFKRIGYLEMWKQPG